MFFRPDPAAPAPDAAERLSVLLAQGEGGWVLPPEEGDAQAPVATGSALAPGTGPDGATVTGEVTGPDDRDPDPSTTTAPASSWPAWGGLEAERRTPGLSRLLPSALVGGRLDPGRRGALALVMVAVLAALVAGGVVLRGRPVEVVVPTVLAEGTPLPGASPGPPVEVVVSVAGRVHAPGLVRLPPGSRVHDAVQAAGGPVPGVSTEQLNLARKVVDGEQVLVGVDPAPGSPAGAVATKPGLLDLNAAAAADLVALPGIGPVLAQRIVDWRTEHERFDSVEQLREVAGIGAAKYADLASKVTV